VQPNEYRVENYRYRGEMVQVVILWVAS